MHDNYVQSPVKGKERGGEERRGEGRGGGLVLVPVYCFMLQEFHPDL